MTDLDEFAKAAMLVLLLQESMQEIANAFLHEDNRFNWPLSAERIADIAYNQAEAMLAESKRRKEKNG